MVIKRQSDLAQVNITIEAYRSMKAQARSEGRTMKFLISMLIMDYVNGNKERHQSP